ncbi:MAG: DUF885 domain-containing protein [Planctomycetota bacterium]|nr:DUF885 domain-containing protein [Planctomycetota bacterium]
MIYRAVMLAPLVWIPLVSLVVADEGRAAASTTSADDAQRVTTQFQELLHDCWEFLMQESPLWATQIGDHRYNDRLRSQTFENIDLSATKRQEFLKRLQALDREALATTDRVTYDILRLKLQNAAAEHDFQTYLLTISNRSGFHIGFPELRRQVPLKTVRDYENYISRLRQFQRVTRENIALMRRGMETGIVLPSVVLAEYRQPIESHIVADAQDSLLYEPLRELPASLAAADIDRLRTAAEDAIGGQVVPAYREFLKFMQDEYVPACRETVGAAALPRGREYYRYLIRKFTTLNLTPQQIHQLGKSEVRRIQQEMDAVIRETGFAGDFSEFVEFLRSDPKFYAATKEELLQQVALKLKTMDGLLPQLFERLPRMSYGIREVPAYVAPVSTTAYYQPPAGDGTRAGFYFVNTYDLKSRPIYNIEALSLHEAVPGHHLQIALQQELTDLPKVRRFTQFTVFSEGWALYAERLGLEVGMYSDPYQNFGRLNYEMWRACRLVVDTGIHYFGWTRQQAIDFLTAHSALAAHNVRAEIDRYISWPGQALAYKIGELKIRELRKLATEKLGSRFDVRRFHDVVLGSGAVPLPVLEANVHDYIEEVLHDKE